MIRKNKPLITTNRYVAFLDICGFKNMIRTESYASTLYKKMLSNRIFEKQLEDHINSQMMYIDDVNLDIIQVSDSIIIFTRDDTRHSFIRLMQYVNILVANYILDSFMIKGAVSYGEITVDIENHIFFGAPYVKAYEREREVRYYGVIIDESARDKINEYYEELLLIKQETFIPISHIENGIFNSQTHDKEGNLSTEKKMHLNWFSHMIHFNHAPFSEWTKEKGIEFLLQNIQELKKTVPDECLSFVDNTLNMAHEAISENNKYKVM